MPASISGQTNVGLYSWQESDQRFHGEFQRDQRNAFVVFARREMMIMDVGMGILGRTVSLAMTRTHVSNDDDGGNLRLSEKCIERRAINIPIEIVTGMLFAYLHTLESLVDMFLYISISRPSRERNPSYHDNDHSHFVVFYCPR